MSDSLVGAIHVTLETHVVPNGARAIAEAIALLRPVAMIDVMGSEPQAQIVAAHAKLCVRRDWPQLVENKDMALRKGTGPSMLAIFGTTYYADNAEPVLEAIRHIQGIATAESVCIGENHATAVAAEVERIRASIVDLVS